MVIYEFPFMSMSIQTVFVTPSIIKKSVMYVGENKCHSLELS